MMEKHRVFVICRNGGDPKDSNDFCCYALHGEKCGVPDAIGYDNAAHARKFRSIEDARDYIEHKLPKWGRRIHHVSELNPWDLNLIGLPLFAAMCKADEPIPDEFLEPTEYRYLLWYS